MEQEPGEAKKTGNNTPVIFRPIFPVAPFTAIIGMEWITWAG
jgi:hypothetical protein